jgi:hypothetical protein
MDSNDFIEVTVSEVYCDYNYSNPTGFFNLSLPHVEIRNAMYSTMSYSYFKRSTFLNAK